MTNGCPSVKARGGVEGVPRLKLYRVFIFPGFSEPAFLRCRNDRGGGGVRFRDVWPWRVWFWGRSYVLV